MGRHHKPAPPLPGATADRVGVNPLPLSIPEQPAPAGSRSSAPRHHLAEPPANHRAAAEHRIGVARLTVAELHPAENDIRVLADDLLLDSLARVPTGCNLGGILAGWQRDVAVPAAAPPCVDVAARKLSRAQAHPVRAAIGVAAAVATVLAGGAIVGSRLATPGDALWPVATVLWSDRVHSADASHEVRQALNEASTALNSGNAPSAVSALTRASGNLPMVQPLDGRDGLRHEYDVLAGEVSSTLSALAGSTVPTTPDGSDADGGSLRITEAATGSATPPATALWPSPAVPIPADSEPKARVSTVLSDPAGRPTPGRPTPGHTGSTAGSTRGPAAPSTPVVAPPATTGAGEQTGAAPSTGSASSASAPSTVDSTTSEPASSAESSASSESSSDTTDPSTESTASTPSTPSTDSSPTSDPSTSDSTDSSTTSSETSTTPGGDNGNPQGEQSVDGNAPGDNGAAGNVLGADQAGASSATTTSSAG